MCVSFIKRNFGLMQIPLVSSTKTQFLAQFPVDHLLQADSTLLIVLGKFAASAFYVIHLLYNCGRIFFILSFFVGYILSFGLVRLRTIRLSAQVAAHIKRRCSRSRGEDVKITDVIIKKNRIGNKTGDVNDVMPGSDGQRILGGF